MSTYEVLTLVALFLAACWPGYQVYRRIRGANLRLRLTTELFFRISTGFGEGVFVKPVLLAENGNILVERVKGALQRTTSESKKEWEIEFRRFGEVVRNPSEVVSNHYFHSSSALQFVVQNLPLRAVYMGVLKGYSEEFMKIVSELSGKTLEMRNGLPAHLTTLSDSTRFQQLSEEDRARLNDTSRKMTQLGEEYASKLVDKIQLEKGDYELSVTVEYRSLEELFSRERGTSSKIRFSVDETVRDKIRAAFPRALLTEMTNVVFGTNLSVINPEYAPSDAREVEASKELVAHPTP